MSFHGQQEEAASEATQDLPALVIASSAQSMPRRPQRSAQARRLPGRFRDVLPEGPAPLIPNPVTPSTEVPQENPPDDKQDEAEPMSQASTTAPASGEEVPAL
ncbi:hypothetical protein FRC04_010308, partial [Tulasnella sp. 424]